MIFSLHLAGVSSLLGAINSNSFNLTLWPYTSYFDSNIFMSFIYLFLTIKKPIIKNPINFIFYGMRSRTFISNFTSDCAAPHAPLRLKKRDKEDWKIILGRKGTPLLSHKLAMEQIKSHQPVNFKVINEILAYCNISINEEILNTLINVPSILIKNLDTNESKKIIKYNIGSPSSKIQIPGVYIFTHKFTGAKYVGSSSQLAIRLSGYLNKTHKPIGKFVPLLLKENISNFSLEIIPLVDNYIFKSEIVLEQYFLLDPSFNLNTVKVANNPSGSNAKPLFMYNRDKTILYYSSIQQKDFIINLNISHFTFSKHLKNSSYYLGKYLFSREPVLNAKVSDITILELALQLEKDRKLFNKNKPLNSLSKTVLMCLDLNTSISRVAPLKEDSKDILFFSIGKCVEYLRGKGLPATQTTLVKYIDTGKSYYGYIFKYV
jgi:hypothetical protein